MGSIDLAMVGLEDQGLIVEPEIGEQCLGFSVTSND